MSLADLSYVYLEKKIQKYDEKTRPFAGHNVEIDARNTLKLGVRIEMLDRCAKRELGLGYKYMDLLPNWMRNFTYKEVKDG